MRIRLRGSGVSREQQEAHDRTSRIGVVVAFFAVIAAFAYLLSGLSQHLGLPPPGELAQRAGLALAHVFDADGNVATHLRVPMARGSDADQRLILFGIITGAFLSGYFLPLRLKRPSYVLWFLAACATLYGAEVTAMFLAAHLAVYLVFHASNATSAGTSVVFGLLLGCTAIRDPRAGPGLTVFTAAATAITCYAAYVLVVRPFVLRDGKGPAIVRVVASQFPVIVMFTGVLSQGLSGHEWTFPLGILFFMLQWARMTVYHADYRDGEVPRDLGALDYLSVFLSPAVIANVHWVPYIGQGYAYLSSNFLCRDKNAIVAAGLRIWCVALAYLVLADWAVAQFQAFMQACFGVRVYEFTGRMVRMYAGGEPMSTPTVLFTTWLDQARIFLIYGGVTHFRVGTWRVLGYDMDPQYDRPWLATNLVSLWGRFAFHYREFLVRVFYYPTFFSCFRRRPALRVFTAIMVATALGNPLWGHAPQKLYPTHLSWEYFSLLILRSWPYYVLLGLGISLTQLFLMRRVRTRRPWTLDRWFARDVLCAYLTMQYFALIHIFIRPQANSTLADHVQLFLIGFGIRFDGGSG